MFLRRYTRPKDGKTHTYYALVESVRTESGPRQHVVAYLGELNHDQERRWQRTVVFHNRQGEDRQLRLFPDAEPVPVPDDPEVVQIRLGSVGWTNPRRFGDVWLGLWLWKFLHLDARVDRHVPQAKETVRPADIVAIEVINRLCAPCSEFALAEHWYRSTSLEDLLGVPRQCRDQGPIVPDTGPPDEGPRGDRERPEGPIREPVPTRLRPAALRPDQHLLRGPGRGERPGPSRLFARSPQRLQTDRAGLDRDPRRFPPGPPDAGGQHARSPDRRDHRRDDRGAVREITAGLGHGPGHDQREGAEVPGPIGQALPDRHAAR